MDRPGQKDLTGRRGRPPPLFARNLSSHSRATPTFFCASEARTRNSPPIDQSVDYSCCRLRKIKVCPFWAFVSRQDRRQPRREHITLWEPERPPCPNFLPRRLPAPLHAGVAICLRGRMNHSLTAHGGAAARLMEYVVVASFVFRRRTPSGPDRVLRKAQHYIKDSPVGEMRSGILRTSKAGSRRNRQSPSQSPALH